ncbi:hypothetical protein [Saccharothrix lopnurensis]|uniref:Uncharacterized protein n=1 Tax=Saccharothrix lopnurensis TaxID=1670621 RepID=A0ABW1P1W2_9PSEU
MGPVRDEAGVRAVRPYAQQQLPSAPAAVGPGSAAYVPRLPAAPSAHARPGAPVDLRDPIDRLLHGYLGRGSRFALANALSAYVHLEDDERGLLSTGYVQAQDAAVAALRVGVVDEPVAASAQGAAYLWAQPCLECGAEAERACMGVPSALHVHLPRLCSLLMFALVDLVDLPEAAELVHRAERLVVTHRVNGAGAGAAGGDEDQAAVRELAELHLSGRVTGDQAADAVARGGDR